MQFKQINTQWKAFCAESLLTVVLCPRPLLDITIATISQARPSLSTGPDSGAKGEQDFWFRPLVLRTNRGSVSDPLDRPTKYKG